MAKRKKDYTTLSSIIIFMIVALVMGAIFILTENFTTPLKNFYVTCGNDDFYSDRDNFTMIVGKEYKFNITTNLDIDGTENKYIVSLVPNKVASTTFTYQADGNSYKYEDVTSLSKGFSIVAYKDYFVITPLLDLPEILKLYNGTDNVSGVPNAIDTNLPYFRLVVQSADLSETININFNIKSEQ